MSVPTEPGVLQPRGRGRLALAILGPLALTALLAALFIAVGPIGLLRGGIPPVEELAVVRTTLLPDEFVLDIVNDGPDPVTIAQVLVNDAYWQFEIDPGKTIPRLGKARVRIRYPWEPGSAQFVTFLTSTGVTVPVEIPVATPTPRPTARFLGMFAMLGVYVGVIPVFLGILWLPFLKRITPSTYQFFLALTVGLLVFLGVDALVESIEAVEKTPGVYRGFGVTLIGVLGTILILSAIGQRAKSAAAVRGGEALQRLTLSYSIAFGIGVHNLGEGLAIGGAYASGEMTLGALLVLGFMIHNVTEGVAIVAPVARGKVALRHLAGLGLLAGAPTILGTWTGAFSFSAIWAVLFLAVGAGAVLQVVFTITQSMIRSSATPLFSTGNVAGFLSGLGVMYATGFLAAA
jgi:ZIP family zinc transporter